ncbi:hypothetical protein [Mesorhizobium sp. M7A.F.Ca.US.001.02.1.1]|uniref:hypothetical protein n=1 Tax=Mesorhizobium sp. M7A.F.Ca.US.001.02.1.1 TaxID=2496703 RepID=UPI000FD3F4DC|nr:hypothetical protein [Mesorhizobium sp. M7A.F.Ca.US.001.02.1.1]RVA06537.1 hypothetical protein EN938_05860 [Mesorhizobium sp. M7A.F.Ca.US.001.02.1.1]
MTLTGRARPRSWSTVKAKERTLHIYSLPSGSISGVYFGIRADSVDADGIAAHLAKADPSISVFEYVLDDGAFSVGAQPYMSLSEWVRG